MVTGLLISFTFPPSSAYKRSDLLWLSFLYTQYPLTQKSILKQLAKATCWSCVPFSALRRLRLRHESSPRKGHEWIAPSLVSSDIVLTFFIPSAVH
ncbi:hypothetical protein CC80DRAFT_326136 [Byssothecium circinans]|uniref:Uncharacterized protein n=1 Tax=Byssothecium circinans TaxID=147558 RepID=A0A6A5U3D2_9PLEO|nr:hypothetical protein CC80DRAFT_326136 [Byssothecium circinans]